MSESQQRVDSLIGLVVVAAGALADCKTKESELSSLRSQIKSDAIGRMMTHADPQKPGGTYSATAAEKVVGFDKAFQLHEADERAATAATIRAMGAYEAAKFRARFSIACAELEIIADEPVSVGLGDNLNVRVG